MKFTSSKADFEILCDRALRGSLREHREAGALRHRRLVRGWSWLNPFAAEFGSNYDVIENSGKSSMAFATQRYLS
ncbi:hypothetical protein [Scytonema sp. HK-05]|uniref:hypothetical protein n=1 Tax=Scytonema sp. HK-05 TaxID=1137095 RepID=UPI000936CE4D|nr:hypothetical protein [Scytonema sp. HK-05]OKH53316.1 hypothetical protein NIES2130_30635 [Scytonema sp. HK-05]